MTAARVVETTPRRARLRAISDGTSGETRAVVRVIIYCRISSDPNERKAGVNRQENEGRALCEQLSATTSELWHVVEVVVDNDRSNSIARKREREHFTALLDRMESGTLDADAIVFFDQDRWVKDPSEWGRWMSLQLRGLGPRVAIVAQGEVDVASPDGFMMSAFRMMSSTTDTMRQVKRIRSFTAEQRGRGKLARVNYGWQRVAVVDRDRGIRTDYRDELHPEESKIVREVARRVLAGESSTAIANDLNARGVDVPSKRWAVRYEETTVWSPSTLRKLMLRPVNVAITLDDEGNETPLAMPPILTRAQWNKLRALFADPERRTITDNRVRHLLAGLGRCDVCGGPLRRKVITRPNGPRYEGYACKLGGHATIAQELAERVVVDTLLTWLRDVELSELLDDNGESAALSAQLDELRSELAGYVADAKRKIGHPLRVSKSELDEHKRSLVPQIGELTRRLSAASSRPGVDLGLAVKRSGDVRAAWDALALSQQRELISTFVDVTLRPSERGKLADPTRVVVTLKR